MASGRRGPADLVARLREAGPPAPAVHAAFAAVERERFVPDRVWVAEDGVRDAAVDRATDPQRWHRVVYSDLPIVTQFDDGDTAWPLPGRRPTSSSTTPSVMARMLSELDVQCGQSVLEIGTGTGYNAAVLAELVGPGGAVTTIEADPGVAERARARLAAAGYAGRVRVLAADGGAGCPAGRWDRVLATAGVLLGRIPSRWVRDTRPGGVVLVPVRADFAAGPLVRFVVGANGTATGSAVRGGRVNFMELRDQRLPVAEPPAPETLAPVVEPDGAAEGHGTATPTDTPTDTPTVTDTVTDIEPWTSLASYGCRWALAVALPSCRYHVWDRAGHGRPRVAVLWDPVSGSVATVTDSAESRYPVRQRGPRRLWDQAAATIAWWRRCGGPPVTAWRWTVGPDGQSVTLPDRD